MKELIERLKTALAAGDFETAVEIREEIAALLLQVSAEVTLGASVFLATLSLNPEDWKL